MKSEDTSIVGNFISFYNESHINSLTLPKIAAVSIRGRLMTHSVSPHNVVLFSTNEDIYSKCFNQKSRNSYKTTWKPSTRRNIRRHHGSHQEIIIWIIHPIQSQINLCVSLKAFSYFLNIKPLSSFQSCSCSVRGKRNESRRIQSSPKKNKQS